MKNKKDVIDLLHNADDSTIEKIVSSDPQYDRKKADRLYKQIERRVEGIDGDFTGGEVSGVEHYRPHRLRSAASMAACLAIVGAGVGTAFALKKGAPEDKSPASKLSTGTVQSSQADVTASAVPLDNSEISRNELYELMLSADSRLKYVSASLDITIKDNGKLKQTKESVEYDRIKGTVFTDSVTADENNNVLRELSYSKGGCYAIYDPDKKTCYSGRNSYNDTDGRTSSPIPDFCLSFTNTGFILQQKDNWEMLGREAIDTDSGKRECYAIRLRNADDITIYIDLETGLWWKYELRPGEGSVSDYTVSSCITSFRMYDTAPEEFTSIEEFKEMLKDCPDSDIDLSFLDNASDFPEEITKEWLLERCKNIDNNFTRCYMETNENGMCVTKAADNKKGIKYYTTENSGRIDYVYGGKRISLFEQTKEVIENPVENMKSIRYDGPLDDLSKWTIEGREEYLGRDCAVIRVAVNPVSSQFDEAFETQWYIDLETGITLRIGVYDRESIQYTVETVKFLLDDEATMIPEPHDICMKIYLNGYTIEDGLDLSFLPKYPTNENGQTYGTDLGNPDNNIGPPDLQAVSGNHGTLGYCYTTDLMLDPYAGLKPAEIVQKQQERSASVKRGVRYIKVYAVDGKTVIDTFICGGNSEDSAVPLPISLIYASLDTLNYHAISCDGLPTHKLTTPAGTVYALHLGETAQDSYVWRRPSLIADDDNEAPLTEEVFTAIYENWDDLNIVETDYFHN